jgi:hypothetical protein
MKFRCTLVYRIESEGWLGRYMYHLPTQYSAAEIENPSQKNLESLRADLVLGADILRTLMERDVRNELKSNGTKVDVGSYYLVAGRIMGLIPANIMHFKDTDLVEEGDDYVIVRSKGDPNASGNAGGLVFGVHYFKKDQLHTYKKIGSAK